MQVRAGFVAAGIVAASAAVIFGGCSARSERDKPRMEDKSQPVETFVPTPFPTVPPEGTHPSPVPVGSPTKAPTPRPQAKPGQPIGPVITFLGITRADGKPIEPDSVDKDGTPTYRNYVGSGFQFVVEGTRGASGIEVGRRIFASSPTDPTLRPDLELEVDRPLGDGSPTVCDKMRPTIGGVPAVNPTNWAETQKIADALNDLSCRFEVFIESDSSCTMNSLEDWQFRTKETEVQFCMMVAKAWNFPAGETTVVSARLRDRAGNPGPVKKMKLYRPKEAPTPRPRPTPEVKSKELPVRP